MKALVVGGTGLTGACIALHLREAGHDVTIMSRNKPALPALADFAHIAGDYIADEVTSSQLQGFEWLVFAAGADIRQLPKGEAPDVFFQRANSEAIPRFFTAAKAAGISRAVYIGSYYPQVVPEKIASDAYVRSRHLADEGIRALSDEAFCVCSLNAPFILGHIPGLEVRYLKLLADYALGRIEGLPLVAPAGGVNHVTAQSMAEAALGTLLRGECGRAYLVGDQNLSWKAYLELYFSAAGKPIDLQVSREEHPLFPDSMLYAGRNATIEYEPEGAELGYGRQRVGAAIAEIVNAYR